MRAGFARHGFVRRERWGPWIAYDGNEGVLDEAKERVAMILVIANRRRQRLGWQQGRLDRVEPALEILHEGKEVLLSMLAQGIASEAKRNRLANYTPRSR